MCNNFIKKLLQKILILGIFLSFLNAHSLWVNTMSSSSHNAPHIMLSLGWGHTLPLGDSTNAINGRIGIDSFELIQPNKKVVVLQKPKFQLDKPMRKTKDYELFDVDRAIYKIQYKKDAKDGLYTLVAKSKPTYYTLYVDTNGKQRFKLKPINELSNVQKVLGSFKYQAFGKSYINLGKWEQPKPLGLGLEIIPLTDLSRVKVGDVVEFEVLFHGKPLSANPLKQMDYITAYSDSFGQSKQFALFSYILVGKASFVVQSQGQWIVNVLHKESIKANEDLKEERKKTKSVYYGSTLTFHVK